MCHVHNKVYIISLDCWKKVILDFKSKIYKSRESSKSFEISCKTFLINITEIVWYLNL